MLIDLHLHEKTYSPDSSLSIEALVNRAKHLGLDAVCITDHDTLGFTSLYEEMSKKLAFPIFVGAEYLTTEGDILAYGINELPRPGLSAQEFINFVNDQGGACTAAHPYRNNNRGLGDHVKTVKGLTGVEVLNGSSTVEENRLALESAKKAGLHCTGGSDAHWIGQVGIYATQLAYRVNCINELAQALLKGDCKPVRLTSYENIDSL